MANKTDKSGRRDDMVQVITTLLPDGEEVMGPEILLWHYPRNDIASGDLLTVESNQFCVMKSRGAIIYIYEMGQYPVVVPEKPLIGSFMRNFFDGQSPWQFEALYISRSKLVGKITGQAFSREMIEMRYNVDYYFHVNSQQDALSLVQYMPYRGHTLTTSEVNAHAGPIVEQAVNQVVQVTARESVGEKSTELTQFVFTNLQEFLKGYGITLDTVKVLVYPPAERARAFEAHAQGTRSERSRSSVLLRGDALVMEYLDIDVDVSLGIGHEYPVSLRSPAGQAHEMMRFPFDTLELENHMLKLQNALLNSGGGRRKVLTPNEEAVQRFGQALFEALLPPDLRGLYYESKSEAARLGKGVRLRLHLRDPKLAALPWEYLYDPRAADYLCLARQTPLVRYLDLPHSSEPLTVTPPLRVLVMLASPTDQEALNIEREQERMRRALEPLEAEGLLKMHWLEGQTWRDLQRALQGGPWHVFHFIGHGGFDNSSDEGVLALADERGKTALIHATQLARLLANHGWVRLAVLNACEGARGSQRDLFSSTAATVARMGVPAVLAMQEAITDHAAIELTRAFYEALAMGLPVDTAVAEARVAISLEVANTLEWGTPVLYLRASDGVLFHM